MTESTKRRVSAMSQLVLAIMLSGVVLAGLLLPWVGGPGIAARNATALLDQVPESLSDEPPAGMTTVLASDGRTVLTYMYDQYRVPVTIEQIPDVMRQAIIATEDVRFYQHNGLDVQGVLRALITNVAAGEVQEGASTITQQLVKLTLLATAETPEEAQAATEETPARKLREARLALAIEETLSKDEILTRYLNIAYFGGGAYGIEAAARTYFNKGVADLTLPEAAMLAGLVQSPADFDPLVNVEAATTRRNVVLDRMATAQFISAADNEAAKATPITIAQGVDPPRGCYEAVIGGFFCDYLEKYLLDTLNIPPAMLKQGSLTVVSTIDVGAQLAGDASVLGTLAMEDSRAGIFTLQEPGTGKVRALSVNRAFGNDGADPRYTTVNLPTVAAAGAGSTYKVFIAAAALERQMSLYYTQTTPDPYVSTVYKDGGEPYDVQNAGRYPATLDMERALYMSSNTYFLALEDALGSVEEPVRMAQRMGLYSIDGSADQIIAENRGSFTFGPEPTSPLALGTAYATLAANGTRCYPTPVEQIYDRNGQPLLKDDGTPYVDASNCTPASIPPGLATTLNQALRKDVEPGFPGQTGANAYIPGRQIAGKTGTSQNNFSVAFVGWTPQLVGSVMVYNPKANENVGGFGGGKGAEIWRNAMQPILAALPVAEFAPADPFYQNGNTTVLRVNCVGNSSSNCQAALRALGLNPVVRTVSGPRPAGNVVSISPSSGDRVVAGQNVTVNVSDGSVQPAPPPAPNPPPQPQPPPGPPPGRGPPGFPVP
ncbi:MAG: transglycosylase domain-containing protein [Actinomycetota bacterium]|nr:transglycosylase domain-containing protein [Actinomycetota bacterium]